MGEERDILAAGESLGERSRWGHGKTLGGYPAVTEPSTGQTSLIDLRKDPRRERDVSPLHPSLVRDFTAGVACRQLGPTGRGRSGSAAGLGYIDE
jgi:hypothetical protein